MIKHDRLHDLVRRFVMARDADPRQVDAGLTDEALEMVAGGDGTVTTTVSADAAPAIHKLTNITLKRGYSTP